MNENAMIDPRAGRADIDGGESEVSLASLEESGQIEMTDPVELSVGGLKGHLFRRFIHLAMVVLPFGYYIYGEDITHFISELLAQEISREQLVSVMILIVIIGESIRLKLGVAIFGQREYEARQVSALAWGAIGIAICVLVAPEVGKFGAAYGMPLILCLVLGDPAIGEARRMGANPKTAFMVGTGVCLAIWLASWYFLATPLWLAPLMAPLCTASEWPRLKYIDDNATMLLIPLAAIVLLHPFTGL
ncbi:MAG TPA: hypothetical protein EYN46_00815 [Candidatus Poseidoniales archaeon]|nr:hypothetical protein [Candidatus Poseidoniales archaeon]